MPFQSIASLYPNAARELGHGLKSCASISDQNFRKAKYKICNFVGLASRTMQLDDPIREQLLDAVIDGDLREATDFLDAIPQGSGSSKKTAGGLYQWTTSLVSRFIPKGKEGHSIITIMQEAIKETPKASRNISDSQFLSEIIKTEIVEGSVLKSLAENAQEMAISYLRSTISHLVEQIVTSARLKQEELYTAEIKAEISRYEDGEQRRLRSRFIRQVNLASNQEGYV